jgi:hypothetical protein
MGYETVAVYYFSKPSRVTTHEIVEISYKINFKSEQVITLTSRLKNCSVNKKFSLDPMIACLNL